jgi:hypothetical protein
MKYVICFLAFAVAFSASAADVSIQFAAYLWTAHGGDRFVITEPARGVVSGWMRVGQSFSSYTVTEYLPEREVLIVVKNGVSHELRLKESKVADGSDQAPTVEMPVRMILREDGTVFTAGKTLPVESLAAYLHGLALQRAKSRISYSVLAEAGVDPAVMDVLKAQLLHAIPQPPGTVVKIQGAVPPSGKK